MAKRKQLAYKGFYKLFRLFPSIYWIRNPFKVFEFYELTKKVREIPHDTVIDVGSGLGLQTILISRWARSVIGVDPYIKDGVHPLLSKHFKGVKFLKQKLENIEIEDRSIDVIVSFSVIEHIPNYQDVLERCFDLLKPGGYLIFSCDTLEAITNNQIIEGHKESYHVQVYFRENMLNDLLTKVGFSNLTIYPIFTSSKARELFIEGIERKFQYGFWETKVKYKKLKVIEREHHSETKGLFLVVSACKP